MAIKQAGATFESLVVAELDSSDVEKIKAYVRNLQVKTQEAMIVVQQSDTVRAKARESKKHKEEAIRAARKALLKRATTEGKTIIFSDSEIAPQLQENIRDVILRLNTQVSPTTEHDKAAQHVLRRVHSIVSSLLDDEKKGDLAALSAMNDTELIYSLALRSLENKSNENARLMRMQLKGAQRFESLLSRYKGDTDVEGAARLLGASTEAVRKRIQRRGLVAYKKGSAVRIPCAQFKDNQVLDGLPDVLKQLPSAEGKSAVLALLTPGDSGKSIIELLREGDKSRAIAEAKHHLQHIGR